MKDLIIKNNEKTPYYIFNILELKNRINKINEYLPENSKLCYAIKANPFLLNYIKNEDLLFEVCSPGELSICEKYNVDSNKIVFSGVCKTQEDIDRAYKLKVKTITLESELHCDLLINSIKHSTNIHNQEVIIRLSSGNQFGMSPEKVETCIKKLKEIESIKIRGIHFFSGTQKKFKKITEEVEFIQNYCTDLQTKTGIKFDSIEYGPGLSYDYFSINDEKNNFSELIQFAALIKDSEYMYVIELGRYIASSCGSYVTELMDIKENANNNYCIIDGGINHINYYGQMMGMKLPEIEHIKTGEAGNNVKYTICGSLCTTADVILRELILNNPKVGDKLVFKNIGAYSITEGIYLFLSHPLPSIYIYQGKELEKIRTQIESFEINS